MKKLLWLLATIYSSVGYSADLALSTSSDWRWVFHNTTYRGDGFAIAALILAAVSTATAVVQNNDRIKAAQSAKDAAKARAIAEQNKLQLDKAKRRREQRGTVLGGQAVQGSEQSAILSQDQTEQTSLLGG